jgi:sugar phosphate isomerase/epimerase
MPQENEMEAGLHSWSFRNAFQEDDQFNIRTLIDMAAEMGFGALEVMTGKAGDSPTHIGTEDPDELKKLLDYAAERDVRIVCASTFNDFAYVKDDTWRLANIEYIKRWLLLCGEVGIPNIRMLTGYYQTDEPREELEQLTRDGIRECVPVAEKAGVNMAIENHNSIFFQADEIVSLIQEIDSDRLTACPDPSNGVQGFLSNEASEEEREQAFETARTMGPYATQSHLKVSGLDEEGRLMGWGDDLDRLVRAYYDAGYDGVIAFEAVQDATGDREIIEKARRMVEDAINRIWMAE